jgi:hypothetical protein
MQYNNNIAFPTDSCLYQSTAHIGGEVVMPDNTERNIHSVSARNSPGNPVLDNPRVARFLEENRNATDAVNRAVQILSGKPDLDAALAKLLPALGNKIINVFFSYKRKDENTANEIIQILRQLSAEKLNIVHQGEFEQGTNWRDAIKNGVETANWFILLLPDPSDDWDWCFFETGLFVAQATSADRLICLHHPNIDRPSQISDFESVPATQGDVERFLRMALVEDNPISGLTALNKAVENSISDHATEIVNAIRPPSRLHREIFEPYVELRIPNARDLASADDLDGATILESNSQVLDIFDYIEQPATWSKLHKTITTNTDDHRWREELFHVIRKIGSKRKFFPVQAVFQSRNGKMYKPVVNAVNRNGERGPIESFCIIFAEEVGAFDDTQTPKQIALVGKILRYTFRFRWEILEKYTKQPLTVDDVECIDNTLRRIKVDVESRGINSPEELVDSFPQANRPQIMQMLEKWLAARNPNGTGTLDLAIENKDPDKAQAILKEFIPINQEFLEIASRHLASLIEKSPVKQ